MASQKPRNLVVISGYYGFGNLGDEAILEQLLNDLKRLVPADNIVVLSANPAYTTSLYQVRSINRWQISTLLPVLKQARLFISGGGGLFQDTRSIGSVLYYAGQIFLS